MPAPKGIDKEALAQQYGWSMAVLRSDKELFSVFNRMVKEGWTEPKFVAELRSTKWFQKHSEAWRQNEVLKRADPATWEQRRTALAVKIQDQGRALGAVMTGKQMATIAANAMAFGWDEGQIRNTLAGYIKASPGRTFIGQAGEAQRALTRTAHLNGIKLGSLQGWVRQIAAGNQTLDDYENHIRQMAKHAFPVWAKELDAGMNLADLAAPYTQSMGQILELNPQDIDLFDPTIRRALSAPDPGTGKPTAKPLWQFETELRKDKRWLRTNNAQNALMSTGHQLLQSFGLAS